MSSLTTDHGKGLLITAIGGLALTVDIPLIRLAEGEPWSIMMLRNATTFGAAILIWAVWRMLSGNAPQLVPGRAGLVVAALYGVTSITFITAVYNTSTANLVFILAFSTMFATLLSWAFLGERPRPATLIAMAVMILGIGIIVYDGLGHGNFWGDALALATALTVASAITVSRASGKDMGFTPLVGVGLPFVVAAVMVADVGYSVAAPWWIVLNGAVVMPLAFFCLATGPRFISAPEVAMFYLLETVLAPVWVWLIFAEAPTRNALIGGMLLIAALLAHSVWQLLEGRRRRAATVVRHPA